MASLRTSLESVGRVTRSSWHTQPTTDRGKMADQDSDFQTFVRESLIQLTSLPAELKSVKAAVDTLIKDGLDMQTYMSTLSDELKEMKVTIKEQRHEVAALRREIKQPHECNQDLTDKNSYLKEEIPKLETYLRKKNLVVEGVEETNSEEVMDKVITLLASMCKIVLHSNEIDKIHRYGKSVAGRPLPIIIRFMSHSSRDRILFSYRSLKEKPTNFFINEDLPYEVKTRRADIRAVAKQAKSSGAKVKLQGDRVYIDNTVFTFDTLKHVHKHVYHEYDSRASSLL